MLLEVRRYNVGRGHWGYKADVSGVQLEWRDEGGHTTLLELGLAWPETRELAGLLQNLIETVDTMYRADAAIRPDFPMTAQVVPLPTEDFQTRCEGKRPT